MKTTSILKTIMLSSCFLQFYGQVEIADHVKRICVKEFYIHTGLFSERNTSGTLKDFQTLAPQSVLLNRDLKDYSSSQGISLISNTMFSMLLGIQFSDKKKTAYKTNPLLRLGLSYFSGSTLTGNLFKEDRKTFDTLTSAQTGQITLVDSVNSRSYGMNYRYEQLRIDGSLIFRTKPEARWSLFAGIGITAGLSINANTEIYYSQSKSTQTRNSNSVSSSSAFSAGGEWKMERIRNKNNFGMSAYIPLGIDFRIGNKKEFWKRMHLFYELRPGINMTSIPELRNTTNVILQQGLGLKIAW